MKIRTRSIRWAGTWCLAAALTVWSGNAGSGIGTLSGADAGVPEVWADIPEQVWAAETGDDGLTVTGLTWDESDGTARWDSNENARYYQVRLYRNGSSVGSTHTTKDHYYEFEESITRKGDYHFEVRATGQGTTRGPWASSYEWYVTSSEAEDLGGSYHDSRQDVNHGPGVAGGGYYSNNGSSSVVTQGVYSGGQYVPAGPGSSSGGYGVGSSGGYAGGPGVVTGSGSHWCLDQYGWWYQYADGTYPYHCWQCIDNRWYCFNESGYIRYGWIQQNENWYFCGADGALLANTRTPDGYYVGEGGIWIP